MEDIPNKKCKEKLEDLSVGMWKEAFWLICAQKEPKVSQKMDYRMLAEPRKVRKEFQRKLWIPFTMKAKKNVFEEAKKKINSYK